MSVGKENNQKGGGAEGEEGEGEGEGKKLQRTTIEDMLADGS